MNKYLKNYKKLLNILRAVIDKFTNKIKQVSLQKELK